MTVEQKPEQTLNEKTTAEESPLAHDPIISDDIADQAPPAPNNNQPSGAESAQQNVIAELQKKVDTLTAELEKTKDQALRAQAEAQNTKRRAEADVEKAHKFALDKFVESLIPIMDSLEKGIESAAKAQGSHEAMKEGMELTLKLFVDTLNRFKVEAVDPQGQPFDPNYHQAMSMVPNPDVEPNTVIDVFQKGYTLNGRVIRPAMVIVSKGS